MRERGSDAGMQCRSELARDRLENRLPLDTLGVLSPSNGQAGSYLNDADRMPNVIRLVRWIGLTALGRLVANNSWGGAPGCYGGAPLALTDWDSANALPRITRIVTDCGGIIRVDPRDPREDRIQIDEYGIFSRLPQSIACIRLCRACGATRAGSYLAHAPPPTRRRPCVKLRTINRIAKIPVSSRKHLLGDKPQQMRGSN